MRKGFTLIELVIVVTVLAIVAAVAIPTFQNMQTHAKNSATKGAVSALRSAIQLYRMQEISSGRRSGNPGLWPHNGCPDTEITPPDQPPIGSGGVMEGDVVPNNPWATDIVSPGRENWIEITPSLTASVDSSKDVGWMYNRNSCQIWANTSVNGENTF